MFITVPAAGIPISSSALAYGETPTSSELHGRIVTSRNTEPTKKTEIRTITEFVAREIARAGSSDSAAATVAISAPTIEKITTTTLEKIAPTPLGVNPPWDVRLEKSSPWLGQMPKT